VIFVPSFNTGTNGGFGLPPSWFRKREQCDLVRAHMPISGLIGRDFGMQDDEVTVQVRAEMLGLFLRRLRLDLGDGLMEVRNRDEVVAVLREVAGGLGWGGRALPDEGFFEAEG